MYLSLVITSILLFQCVPAAFATGLITTIKQATGLRTTIQQTTCSYSTPPQGFDNATLNAVCDLSYTFPNLPTIGASLVNAAKILNVFNSAAGDLVGTLSTFLDDCPNIKKSSDYEIAKRFRFLVYDKNGCGPLIVNGTRMINNSYKSIFKDPKAPIVMMMPGWTSFCTNLKPFQDNATWTTDTAPKIAKKRKAYVIVVDWGAGGLSCCNYFQIVFCNIDIIAQFLAKVIRNCFANQISGIWLIGHSLGAQTLAYVAQNLRTPVAKCVLIDPAGPGWSSSCSPIGKISAFSDQIARIVVGIHSAPGSLGTVQVHTPCTKGRSPCGVDIQMKNHTSYCWGDCIKERLKNSVVCDPDCAHDSSAYTFFPQWVSRKRVYVSSGPQRYLSLYNNSIPGSYVVEKSDYLRNSPVLNISITKGCKFQG